MSVFHSNFQSALLAVLYVVATNEQKQTTKQNPTPHNQRKKGLLQLPVCGYSLRWAGKRVASGAAAAVVTGV